MKTYKVHEAKTNLSKILNEVQEGETVYIAKGKVIVAELIPHKKQKKPFPIGIWADQGPLDDDWDSPETNKEIEELFTNSKLFPEDENSP